MSMPPEPPPEGGGMMSQRIMGMPAPVFVIAVALVAYFLFFRNSKGSAPGGTGGSGSPQTGDISITPGSTQVTINDTSPDEDPRIPHGPGRKPRHHTRNPQPRPVPKPKTKTTSVPVAHKAGSAQYVTVGKWQSGNPPWDSTLGGIARHEDTSVAELLKLNPGIRNPDLVRPGQKIRVR